MHQSGDQTLRDLLASLASDHISPGSGTAAAAAMALCAGCAAKALAISRKHRAPDTRAQAAEARLTDIIGQSLLRADADAACFEAFIRHRNQHTAGALLGADRATQALARDLAGVLDEIEPIVHPVVSGDILAARALLEAAARIQTNICAENHRAASALL